MKTFRAGLVGAGYVSEFHVQALQRLPDVQIAGIFDVNSTAASAAAARWGYRQFSSLEELVDAGANVIHVLTPPATHADITIEALERGCDVLVEKPLATSVEDCDRIAEAAARAGRTVGVNHSLLRDPFVARTLDAVRHGAVGDLLTVDYFRSSDYPPHLGGPLPPPYRDGGYPFRDLGIHALYLLQEFLGEIQAARVEFRSAGRASRDPNIHFDEWRALVRCARGSGQIQLSWNVRPLQHQLFIQGTRGTLRADLFAMFVASRKTTPLPKSIERAFNALNEARQIEFQTTGNALRFLRGNMLPFHGLQTLVAEFYENLAAGRPAPITVAQARLIVHWTEHLAREADAAKERHLARYPKKLTAPVLVTGAGGFIGRHLVRRLLGESQRVRAFVRRDPPAEWLNDSRVEVVLGDLGDPETVERAVAGTEIVYHLGAAMSGRPEDFQRGTTTGTLNVVNTVLAHRVPKLVYVSSLSVLHAAAAKPGVRVKEDWPLEPRPEGRGAYTQSKLAAERLVSLAVKKRGLNAVVLRPGQAVGPGAELITGAVAQRLGRRLVILGDGRLVLPLVHVEDVVDALLLAARSDCFDGSIFHIVDDAGVTQENLARRVGRPIIHVPLPLVYALAFGARSLYRVRSALAPLSFDCAAARDRLGWQPRIGVRAGLDQLR